MEKLILDKSTLNEEVSIPETELPSVELEEPIVIENEPTKEEVDNGTKGILNDFLSATHNAISMGESIVATLVSEGAQEPIVAIINKIVDDYNVHVGMLQEAIGLIDGEAHASVESGKVEGQEIIENEFKPEGEEVHDEN